VRVAAGFLALAVAGCASLFHKPRPDLELSVEQRPWRVRCGYWLPPSGEPGASPRPRGEGSTWARDTKGRRLIVDGRIEDGFLVVDAVRAASDKDDRDRPAYPATARDVKRACAIALDHEVEGEQPWLHTMAAMRDGEGIDVPLVFSKDPELPHPISRMVVFGDSLSDVGNLKRRLIVFPNTPYWLGRFANGPNWTEYFTQRTGVAVQNDAFGGAVAVKHEDVPSAGVIASIEEGAQFFLTGSIERQVTDYLERDLAEGTVKAPADTAFVLWGGANDYISKEPFTGEIRTLLDDPRSDAGYIRVVNETVDSLVEQIRRLHASGAQRFVVLTLPDLGKTPIVLQNESYTSGGAKRDNDERRGRLSKKLGELTAYHNDRLKRAVTILQRTLPGTEIVTVESDRLVDRILRGVAPDGSGTPFDYGFALREREAKIRYWDSELRLQKRCYHGSYIGSLTDDSVCAEWENAMFWDIVHPTSYTHCWIAYFVQREMARHGLVAEPPSPLDQRGYCIARTQPVF
jgi:thermolabile hemolysin